MARVVVALLLALATVAGCSSSHRVYHPQAMSDRPAAVPLESILSDPSHMTAVLAAQKNTPMWIKEGCAEATFTPIPGAKIWPIPIMPGVAGAGTVGWLEATLASGCGRTVQLNALSAVVGPNSISSWPLAPGTTIADPRLQKDLLRPAAALAGKPGCSEVYGAGTEVVTPPADMSSATGNWTENWVIAGCGARSAVRIDFSRNPSGTDFVLHKIMS